MVAIGVTGHRTLINEEQLLSGVDQVLDRIQGALPNTKITIISPLAEGADRLVAWRAMTKKDADLIVPLPLDVSEYMQDFSSKYSKAEFATLLEQATQVIDLPHMMHREDSYLAAGLYVLKQCDILIAIWDGQPARGAGGTAQIVILAREHQKPLAWIFAGHHGQDNSSASLLEYKPGEVIYENFPQTS